jgi:hypothetical protein
LLNEEPVIVKGLTHMSVIVLPFVGIHPEQCSEEANRHFYRPLELQANYPTIAYICENIY